MENSRTVNKPAKTVNQYILIELFWILEWIYAFSTNTQVHLDSGKVILLHNFMHFFATPVIH